LEGGPGYPKYIGTLKFSRMTPFRVYNNPTKGFGLIFFVGSFWDPPGASLRKFDLWGGPPQTNREQYRPIIGIRIPVNIYHTSNIYEPGPSDGNIFWTLLNILVI